MSVEKPSKTMLDHILQKPSNREMIERGLLPSGCAFHVETASKYTDNALESETLEDCLAAVRVVREQINEIKEKIRKVGK